MGIKFSCPNGHKLHVKEFLAGKRGICPQCGAKVVIPPASTSPMPGRLTAGAASGAPPRVSAESGPPSIMIAIVEPSRATLAPARPMPPPPVVAQPAAVMPVDSEQLPVSAEPIASETALSVSPATKYIARRTRSRRNQMTIAIGLLIAVIVLALILIWVLQNQSTVAGLGVAAGMAGFAGRGYAASPLEWFRCQEARGVSL